MCNCLNYGLLLISCVGLSGANSEYSELVSSGTTVENTLRSVGWNVDELSRLDRAGRQLTVELQCLIDQLNGGQSDSRILNRIHCVCESATSFLKGNCCLCSISCDKYHLHAYCSIRNYSSLNRVVPSQENCCNTHFSVDQP